MALPDTIKLLVVKFKLLAPFNHLAEFVVINAVVLFHDADPVETTLNVLVQLAELVLTVVYVISYFS